MNVQELLANENRTTIETWCRRNAQAVFLGDWALCRVLGKYLMYVDPTDRSLAPHLMLDGYWEMWITMAIARYIKLGMRCIDVGANVGYYSVLLADCVGPDGFVWSFEPEYRNHKLLTANLNKLGVSTTKAFECAASEREGKAKLEVDPYAHGNHKLVDHVLNPLQFQIVDTVRIDDALADEHVDFIKLDVEGHEYAVWCGMSELLKRNPNVQIAAEWTRRQDPEAEFVSLAEASGFRLHNIETDGTLKSIAADDVRNGPDWRMLWFKR